MDRHIAADTIRDERAAAIKYIDCKPDDSGANSRNVMDSDFRRSDGIGNIERLRIGLVA